MKRRTGVRVLHFAGCHYASAAILLAAAPSACGSASAALDASTDHMTPPSVGASRDARMDVRDASLDLMASRDGSAEADAPIADASLDAPRPVDATLGIDAVSPPDATSPPDAATPPPTCPGPRNVFTLTQSTSGGPLGNLTTTTLTNLDALWSTSASPLTLTATEGSGVSASLTLSTLSTLTPGTYPQGSALPDGGASVALSFAGNSCQVVSGAVRLASLTTDDAGVGSVLATFTLACAVGPGETDEVTGCVRYAATESPDATAYDAGWDAGLADAGAEAGALLLPCLGMSHAFFVSGPPLAPTSEVVTGAVGNWAAGEDGIAMLTVEAAKRWSLALGAGDGNLLAPGTTYADAGNLPEQGVAPYFSLVASGVTCEAPNASFTVYAYEDTGGDEATITKLVATFSTECTAFGMTGVVTGCVSYEE